MLMVGKANKNINNINYLNIKPCFGGHGPTLFISRSHKFQQFLENMADSNDHDTIYCTSVGEKSLSLQNSEPEVKPSLWTG